MAFGKRFSIPGLLAAVALAAVCARAGTPTAAINASPVTGVAPLGVSFDASASSPDVQTFLWDFGDGGASTAKSVTHIYNVAGTYMAALTVTNAAGQSASSQIAIVVGGASAGPVTSNANFRWVLTAASFVLNRNQPNKDALNFSSVFNTVDLPARVDKLAVSFSVNSSFTISGVLAADGTLLNPERRLKPTYSLQLDVKNQLLNVAISKAELKAALALSGAKDATVPQPGILAPVTFTLTIGAQTYSLTEDFAYTATAGSSGRGKFNLKSGTGAVEEGFFAIARASALENTEGTGHYFEFSGYLSRPLSALVKRPGTGTFVLKFHNGERIVVPFDRLRGDSTHINFAQSERALGGVRNLAIDASGRRITIKTWDIPADITLGGTGLPIRGQFFLTFNFAIRLELDQPDGTTFQVVTATMLTRHTKDDAFWQTGRKR